MIYYVQRKIIRNNKVKAMKNKFRLLLIILTFLVVILGAILDIDGIDNSNDEKETPVINNDPVKESAIFFGDSITHGKCMDFTKEEDHYSWTNYIKDTYDIEVYNMGVNGRRLGKINKLYLDIENTDDTLKEKKFTYVILHGGINDVGGDVPIGTYDPYDFSGNYDTDTFLGGLEMYLYDAIKTWPKSKIGYIINYKNPKDSKRPNEKTKKYFDLLKEVLEKWQISYIDLYEGVSNDGKRYSEDLLKVDTTIYLFDRLHLRKEGYEIISPYIYEWMKTLDLSKLKI